MIIGLASAVVGIALCIFCTMHFCRIPCFGQSRKTLYTSMTVLGLLLALPVFISSVQGGCEKDDAGINEVAGLFANIFVSISLIATCREWARIRSGALLDMLTIFIASVSLGILGFMEYIGLSESFAIFVGVLVIIIALRDIRDSEDPFYHKNSSVCMQQPSTPGKIQLAYLTGTIIGAVLFVAGICNIDFVFDMPDEILSAAIIAVAISIPQIIFSIFVKKSGQIDASISILEGCMIWNSIVALMSLYLVTASPYV